MASTRVIATAAALAAAGALPGAEAFFGMKATFSADPQNPTSEDVFTPRASSDGFTVMSNDQEEVMTKESSEFTSAVMRSFLARQEIPDYEMQCLQDGSGEIGANMGKVLGDFGVILRKAFGTAVPKIPDREFETEEAGPTPEETKEQQERMQKAKKAGKDSLDFFYDEGRRLEDLPAMLGPEAFPVAMQVGVSIQRVVKEMRELVGKCIHSDARNALEIAGMHARNLTYITGHFLANGADIAEELADSVMGYETRNVTQVGLDVGRALRKIFLSKNNQDAHLPEGMPGEAELANVTEGFLLGFFGPGTYLQVKLRKDAAHPVLIDMHSCIRQDVSYFQQIWAATLFMFAQGASSGKALNSETSKIEFGTTLAFSMMELPSALERCGLSEKQQSMIMDSVKALGSGMQTQFQLPKRDLTKDQWAEELAVTIKDWSEHRWLDFGMGLGAFLQQSALHVYPEKYSLDSTGALQAQFETRGPHSSFLVLLVPCCVLLAALALVVRRHQSVLSPTSASKRAAQKPRLFAREPQSEGCLEGEGEEEGEEETETEVDVESQETAASSGRSLLLQAEARRYIE